MERVKVSIDEVMLAYERWLELCTPPARNESYESFNVFCQLANIGFVERTEDGYLVTSNVAERIRLLTGPHWYAILKAYYAINSEEQQHAPSPTV